MTLGGPRMEPTGKVKKLEAEIARLRAELENERAHNKRLLAQLENWDLIEMNKDNMRLQAALEAIKQNDCAQKGCDVYEIARKALAKERKDV